MLTFAKILLVIIAIVLVAVILLQSGRSAGLSGAIMGGAEQMMGRKARGLDAVLIRLTTIFGVLFFIVTMWVAWLVAHSHI
ncbi:preprotein translocase subunit SecG [Fodinisporobacter ferrooxydans]|uniref:Protein-export membrane protein SecG n=1 Tax=Fodinisporobacter ferrooxydans TaxID=2901836 RepID=A0ABY4CML6_9BACL|nr:preprotein translocase subunit SecG [Alicyclobacillaceae bacterium MYW30-H2]